MRLLVSGSTKTVGSLAGRWPERLGHLLTPRNRNGVGALLATGLPWAADNGCYSGFDEAGFVRFLARIAGRPRCLFAVVPDVVADARATLALFGEWRGRVAAAGHPVALVGQDGVEDMAIPWDGFQAWFVGGSTRWKLSQASMGLAVEAKRRGKWVHFGRVNSRRRMHAVASAGADSIDGSSASMFGEKVVPKFCRWLDQIDEQQVLWPATV